MGFFKEKVKNVKKGKKGKIFENLGKYVQNLKIVLKRTDNSMQLTARMGPDKL